MMAPPAAAALQAPVGYAGLLGSQFCERTILSKDKAAMLVKGTVPRSENAVRPDDAIQGFLGTGVLEPLHPHG